MTTFTCEGCGVAIERGASDSRRFHSPQCYYLNGKRGVVQRPDLDSTECPNTLDIAWAAGVYEGEGTCHSKRPVNKSGRPAISFSLNVVQKNRWLCERLRALFGGSVLYHERPDSSRTSTFTWDVHGTRARGFALTVYKFLSPRRKTQIQEAMGL